MIVFTDPSRNRKRIRKIEICQQNWESPLVAVGKRGFLIASQVSIKGWAQQSCDAQTPSILKWGLTHDWLLAHDLEALVLPDKSVFGSLDPTWYQLDFWWCWEASSWGQSHGHPDIPTWPTHSKNPGHQGSQELLWQYLLYCHKCLPGELSDVRMMPLGETPGSFHLVSPGLSSVPLLPLLILICIFSLCVPVCKVTCHVQFFETS